jgi:dihydroorotate dehydrogenase
MSEMSPSFSEVASRLLEREHRIAEGKIQSADSRNLIGVTIRPNMATMDSIPYLVQLDYVKGVRELGEHADFLIMDLSGNLATSGIKQFYKNANALRKLLSQVNEARLEVIGKAAAYEFENAIGVGDYSTSVSRTYQK